MKIIVAGSRTFNDYNLLRKRLDYYFSKLNEVIIISGTARGADKLGERYAEEKGYDIIGMPADWNKYGKKAGYIRNEEMAKIADACVLFWDGVSRGTSHMADLANQYKLKLKIVIYNDTI